MKLEKDSIKKLLLSKMFIVGNSENSDAFKAELMSESLETVITALVIGLTLQHRAHISQCSVKKSFVTLIEPLQQAQCY